MASNINIRYGKKTLAKREEIEHDESQEETEEKQRILWYNDNTNKSIRRMLQRSSMAKEILHSDNIKMKHYNGQIQRGVETGTREGEGRQIWNFTETDTKTKRTSHNGEKQEKWMV